MILDLEKIDPKFRQLVDCLFFTNKIDLDCSELDNLLSINYIPHYHYLLQKIRQSYNVFWENGAEFWLHRFSVLLSLENPTLNKSIEDNLDKRLRALCYTNKNFNYKNSNEIIQTLQFCKAKSLRKDKLSHLKNKIIEASFLLSLGKQIGFIQNFVPYVFKDLTEYTDIISKNIISFPISLLLLFYLEKNNVKINRNNLVNLAHELLIKRTRSAKNTRIFFNLISDDQILEELKNKYTIDHRNKLLFLFNEISYQIIEDRHLINIKNTIRLDPNIADDLALIYIKKLYIFKKRHKQATAHKITKLLKNIPEISAKKILGYLANQHKTSDIKYMLREFPELATLIAFI